MNPNDSLIWSGWGVCLVLSFVLSGMEAGIFALNRVRVRQQARTGKKSALMLMKFLRNPEQFLWTIFVGNTLVNFVVLAWILMALEGVLSSKPILLWSAYAVAVLAFYTLFDLLPKMLFRMYPNRLTLVFARPVRFVHLMLRPLVRFVEMVSTTLLGWTGGRVFTGQLFGNREELRAVMQESTRALTSDERVLINRVLDLHAVTVRQVMKPMQLVVTVNMDTPLQDVLALCRERQLTRFPVWEAVKTGQRRIAGMLDLDAVVYRNDLEPGSSIARFVKPAVFLNEGLPVEKALRRMRRGGQQLAVVVGADQRELGLLAMQDVLKRIFGEVAF